MHIRKIKHSELQSYIDSEEYKHTKYIAISKHRALSHIRNPRAKAEDLVLVLIYDSPSSVGDRLVNGVEEMVAYLGVFADDLHFSTGVEHVGWLSCMWVNPIMRGKGVAKKLINTVFEAWDYKILVTEFTPEAYGLYQSTGQFLDLAKPKGLRGYLRLNLSYLLPKKNPVWNKLKGLLVLIDGLCNLPNNLRLKLKSNNCPSFEYLSEIDEEAWAFVQRQKGKELMNRNQADLQWVVRNQWLISSGLQDYNAQRYHFSTTDAFFTFLNVKVYDENKSVIGFLILSIRNKNMKIPYFYCEKGKEAEVLKVIYKHLIDLNLDMLTVFHPALVDCIQQQSSPFFLKRPFQRHYIIGKVLEKELLAMGDFVIQDGDADAAFT